MKVRVTAPACLAVALMAPAAGALAQTPAATTAAATPGVESTPPITGFVEAGAGHAESTGGYADWNDQYLRGAVQVTAADRLNVELAHQSHFRSSAFLVGVGYSRLVGERWVGYLSTATSSDSLFLPRLRLDAMVSRKWLAAANLVTTLGFGYTRAWDTHFDRRLLVSAAYYLEVPWVIELGARANESHPGSVRSWRGFGAITHGYDKRHFISARLEAGREAYEPVARGVALVDFASREGALAWRQWLTSELGFSLTATAYDGPYRRLGGELGIFIEY